MALRIAGILVLSLCLSSRTVATQLSGQGLPTADLVAGISQIRAGDYLGALVVFNTLVDGLAGRADQAVALARVRAYQALTYSLLDQPERTRAFAVLALTADPNVVVDAAEFTPGVIALFGELRRPVTRDPEAVGDTANQGGSPQDAFAAYLRAFQALPDPPPPTDDRRLREKIVGLVLKMTTPPAIPDQARVHLTKAEDLLEAEAILGGAAGKSSQQASVELRQAIRLAPWWPEATIRLATVLQTLNRVDEAILNLNLYRLADPEGYAARAGRAVPRDVAAAPPAAAPPVVPKPAGPALIYIYWPEQQRGGGRQKIFCNGQQVAELQNNRFVVLRAAAGTHDLAFRNKHVSAVVDAGGEYYYRASIEGHWQFAMGPEIRLTAADAATDEMRQQEIKANDARRTSSAECNAAPTAKRRGGLFTAPKKPR